MLTSAGMLIIDYERLTLMAKIKRDTRDAGFYIV